jgi:4-amino-4-deoxy-L-arabinose transferase-like glycosyltransferase
MTSFLRSYRGWILLSLIILVVFAIRVRLLDMPLERDEGEYAYAGQLILHGIPPYKEAYNMKLPGTYAAYAVILAVFGQTPTGIHLGVALVNACTIVLVFLIGRALLDEAAGLVAAAAFGLMSASPSVLGLAGHATHFVTFFAMLGVYLLLRVEDTGSAKLSNSLTHQSLGCALSGLMFGLAFLMKQHGVFFGVFGGFYLIWRWLSTRASKSNRRGRGPTSARSSSSAPQPSTLNPQHVLIYCFSFLLPYLLTCAILAAAGVFSQFWFWTISYASQYASMVPATLANDWLRNAAGALLSSTVLFWLLFLFGAVVMWWDERLEPRARVLLTALVVCSAATVAPGFYFRKHYFITLLPAVALVGGVVVSRSIRVLQRHRTLELFTALPLLALFALGCVVQLAGDGPVWFSLSPRDAVQSIYATTLFDEARKAGEFVRTNSPASARMAVVGSEPELYFYAHKRAATGFMYVYPLMEPQAYALKMQEQMTSEISKGEPQCCVFVQDSFSWDTLVTSHHHLLNWWDDYSRRELRLARVFDVKEAITTNIEEAGLQVLRQNQGSEAKSENAQIQVFTRNAK